MKRVNDIYGKIISIDNLRLADKMARKGKINSYGVQIFDRNREGKLESLHFDLKNNLYKTSKYHIFKIYKPKEREVYRLPYYPDRIVHWAIMIQLEPIWLHVFTNDTYCCIKGRGINGSAIKLNKVLKSDSENTTYCLKFDIKKYYPSIDQGILMTIIKKKIKCDKTLTLLENIITSIPSGVPIGNYISQFAANLYLSYFDHWLKEEMKVKHYFRYCDDFVILGKNKESLRHLFLKISEYLTVNLKLEIKKNYQIFPVNHRGIDFVGYKFYHSHVLLRKGIKKRMMAKLAKVRRLGLKGVNRKIQMASYWGWVSQPFTTTYNLKMKMIS